MDSEEVDGPQKGSPEQVVHQIRSSSTNAQISAIRGVLARLDDEGMSTIMLLDSN